MGLTRQQQAALYFARKRHRSLAASAPAPVLQLSASAQDEGTGTGNTIGTLSVLNGSGTYTYTITDDPDGAFSITGDALKNAVVFDFEAQASYSVTVQADNGVDAPIEQEFTITVGDVAGPTDIALSANSLAENSAEGTAVGTLSATGGTAPYTYSLVDDAGGRFKTSGSALQAGAVAADYESATSHAITVRVTDAIGETFDKDFTVNITDVFDGVGLAVAYAGSGSAKSISGLGFQPDLVITKARSNVGTGWRWTDSVRGATLSLDSQSAAGEQTETGGLTSFDADGFSLGTDADYNASGVNFLALAFRKLAGAFDVVGYTGDGLAGHTVAHNLGVAPELIIIHRRVTAGTNWEVYPGPLASPATQHLVLQSANAVATLSTIWNNTAPTSSVFSLGTNSAVNTSAATYIAYLFASKAGVSKIGTYTGDGNTTGPFVTTGFKPKIVIVKATSANGSWVMFDSVRDPTNPSGTYILLNNIGPDATVTGGADFQPTGFQFTDAASAAVNTSGVTYLYIAVA